MPKLLDLYCCAGGCSQGYHLAGFDDITGVDINPQPRYPFRFVQADALAYLAEHGHEYDAIHASPPCQRYSPTKMIHNSGDNHPDLLDATRNALIACGKPYIIENVVQAPMRFPVVLCGIMFDLQVIRHRAFESSMVLLTPEHPKHPAGQRTGSRPSGGHNGYSCGKFGLVCVAGNNFSPAAARKAMRIDWMTRKELAQAIPPAYTEYLGRQLLRAIQE